MMHHYNVTGEDRKRLVKVASEFLGIKAEYQYMPSCSYKIGTYEISKDGTLSWSDMDDMDPEHMAKSQDLVSALEAAGFHSDESDFVAEQLHDDGFHAEEANLPEPALSQEETDEHLEETAVSEPADSEEHTLCISLPRARFSDAAIQNLMNLLSSKGTLMKRAFQIKVLPIRVTDEQVIFPWFQLGTADETEAYMAFIQALGEMAIDRKRISAKEKPITNEKYEFRCFLLRLGMIGDDTKKIRKILMKNLSGSAAFKNGMKKGGEK